MPIGTGGASPKRPVGLLDGGTVGNPANIRLDGVNTMWLVISENERYLLLEDQETGDVLMPLIYMKSVLEANYSRKLASLKHRIVTVPPTGPLAKQEGMLYWQWAFESPHNIKVIVRKELGEDNTPQGHLRLVILPIVYNAMAVRGDLRATALFRALHAALRLSSYWQLLRLPADDTVAALDRDRAAELAACGLAPPPPLFHGPRTVEACAAKYMFMFRDQEEYEASKRQRSGTSGSLGIGFGNSQEVNLYDMLDGGTPHSGPPAGSMHTLLSQQRARSVAQQPAAQRASGSADLAALIARTGSSGEGGDGALADVLLSTLRSYDQRMAQQAEEIRLLKKCLVQVYGLLVPGALPPAGVATPATVAPLAAAAARGGSADQGTQRMAPDPRHGAPNPFAGHQPSPGQGPSSASVFRPVAPSPDVALAWGQHAPRAQRPQAAQAAAQAAPAQQAQAQAAHTHRQVAQLQQLAQAKVQRLHQEAVAAAAEHQAHAAAAQQAQHLHAAQQVLAALRSQPGLWRAESSGDDGVPGDSTINSAAPRFPVSASVTTAAIKAEDGSGGPALAQAPSLAPPLPSSALSLPPGQLLLPSALPGTLPGTLPSALQGASATHTAVRQLGGGPPLGSNGGGSLSPMASLGLMLSHMAGPEAAQRGGDPTAGLASASSLQAIWEQQERPSQLEGLLGPSDTAAAAPGGAPHPARAPSRLATTIARVPSAGDVVQQL